LVLHNHVKRCFKRLVFYSDITIIASKTIVSGHRWNEEEVTMNTYIIVGLFALAVATLSLAQVLIGYQDELLANLRRLWGRRVGHSLFFIANVAVPLLICVVCLGWGIRQFDELNDLETRSANRFEMRLEIKFPENMPAIMPLPPILHEKDFFLAA
jgi:hypothetical protein